MTTLSVACCGSMRLSRAVGLGGHAQLPVISCRLAGTSVSRLEPRQDDGERGPGGAGRRVGVGLDGDLAAVHLDDAVGDGEAEARSLADLLGREERAEQLVEVLLGDAHALVLHRDDDVLLGAVQRDGDGAAVRHRVLGVGEQVGEHLDDLVAVELGDGVVEVVDDLHRDALGERAACA